MALMSLPLHVLDRIGMQCDRDTVGALSVVQLFRFYNGTPYTYTS